MGEPNRKNELMRLWMNEILEIKTSLVVKFRRVFWTDFHSKEKSKNNKNLKNMIQVKKKYHSIKEIKGMTLPKFKKEYKRRLERLWVDECIINKIYNIKLFSELSGKTFRNSLRSLDWYICGVVLNEMRDELNMTTSGPLPSWYKEEYLKRVKKVEEYEKQLLFSKTITPN
jgi:hypothetical protein